MSIFETDERYERTVQVMRETAEDNPFTLDRIARILRGTEDPGPMGNDMFRWEFPGGFSVVFTIEEWYPGRWQRHMVIWGPPKTTWALPMPKLQDLGTRLGFDMETEGKTTAFPGRDSKRGMFVNVIGRG